MAKYIPNLKEFYQDFELLTKTRGDWRDIKYYGKRGAGPLKTNIQFTGIPYKVKVWKITLYYIQKTAFCPMSVQLLAHWFGHVKDQWPVY